jgi:hypothetical protein
LAIGDKKELFGKTIPRYYQVAKMALKNAIRERFPGLSFGKAAGFYLIWRIITFTGRG